MNKYLVLFAFLFGMSGWVSAMNVQQTSSRDSITRNGYTLIFINNAPEFSQETKKKMEEAFFEVYPVLVKRFNENAAKKVIFVIDPNYNGVAYAAGGRTVYSPEWLAKHPEDIDVVTHEVMHIVQSYGNGSGPMWVTEGIADFVRHKYGVNNEKGGWAMPAVRAGHHYTDSYRITARFFNWMETNMGESVINKLDKAMRDHSYTNNTWMELTGKGIDDLWAEYVTGEGIVLPEPPPTTWKEHWFEHDQLIKRVYYDDQIAVYYDDDMNPSINWPFSFIKNVWKYTKKVYGPFGDEGRLYAIFHAGKYSGGHPATYLDASHDYRNTIDCGSLNPQAWITGRGNDRDIVVHEIGHIVEGAGNNIRESPAFRIWGDSKWMEIYIYDVYVGLGMERDAKRWFDMMMNGSDNFPQPGTQWFKNWFYPIWENHGKSEVLNRFFKLLSENFPTKMDGDIKTYERRMNWGEFVHFWSGAAKTDLKDLADTAFGKSERRDEQLIQAKKDFAGIVY